MTVTPADRLAIALQALSDEDIAALGIAIGATPRIARLAAKARPISADHHLKLAASLGFDPVTGKPRPAFEAGDLQWSLVATGLRLRRKLEGLGLRPFAAKLGISMATLRRAELGAPVTITSLLKICGGLGLHPFGYCAQRRGVPVGVSREKYAAA